MTPDALKGHLDGLLLAVLTDAPAHGYAVVQEIRHRSGGAFALPEGTIYPALHRLEGQGLLRSQWSDAGSRRRRVYEVTRRGRADLERRRREWRVFATAVQAVLA